MSFTFFDIRFKKQERSYIYFYVLLVGLQLILPIKGNAATPELFRLKTSDQIEVEVAWYHQQESEQEKNHLLVIAPGFAQHHQTSSMRLLAHALESYYDIAVISFRGNAGSHGWYSFGAEEIIDLQSLMVWANARYEKISLLGLSLGAYTAYRYAAVSPGIVSELYLVSCPTSVEDIVLSGAAFLNPLIIMVRQTDYFHEPENDIFFRWGWPFKKKENLLLLGDKVKIPCHFLVGKKDTLVYPRLSRSVYQSTIGPKTWVALEDGLHAEHMFHQEPEFFVNWILNSKNMEE